MKKLIELFWVVLAIGFLVGCGSMHTSVSPRISHPANDLVTYPKIESMGDEQIKAEVAYANNPLWTCNTCTEGQTSDITLTKVQEVIGRAPDLVDLQIGAYDLAAEVDTHDVSPLYDNVIKILDLFTAAKIPLVINALPGSTAYDNYYFNEGIDLENQAGIIPYVFSFNSDIDLTDGIPYTQAGLEATFPPLYQEFESFHLGGVK